MNGLQLYQKYGDPYKFKGLALWDVPTELEIGIIPKKIYCNKDLIKPLEKAFKLLIETGAVNDLKTYDGCYNIRPIRGYEKKVADLIKSNRVSDAMLYMSNHSWGTAIDFNAFENQLGATPKMSKRVVDCFLQSGFVWGGNFQRKDGMHFELG